jgi:predicted metalloprotease with PDZ domain
MLPVIRGVVIEGTEVSLPTAVTEPSLELTLAQARNFDPGFNLEASREAKKVVGVHEQGNAYAAGLRDGQELQGFSVSRRDGIPKAEVVILIDGSPNTIEYEAVGPVRDVRVFRTIQTKS